MNLEQFIFLIAGIITSTLAISVILYCYRNDLEPSFRGWFCILGGGMVSIIFFSLFLGWISVNIR